MGSENPVVAAAREPQGPKRLLQIEHVATVKMREPQIQRAIPQTVRGVHQRRPYLLVNLVAGRKPRLSAKRAHRRGGGGPERAIDVRFVKQSDHHQALLDILDRAARIVQSNRFHMRHGISPRLFMPSSNDSAHQSNNRQALLQAPRAKPQHPRRRSAGVAAQPVALRLLQAMHEEIGHGDK